ncbi:MAG: hypothetical protein AABZ41_07405 [Bacteroidota bacterium]
MRFARTLVYSISLFLLIQSSCKSPTEPGPGNFQVSHIVGQIVRSDDNSGIPGAVVRDLTFINVADTADGSGNFDLLYSLDTKLNTRITAISTGFIDHANDTISVSLDPGQTVSGVGVVLGVDSSSPPPGSAYSGIAASIVQVATGPSNISLRGTGSNETTVLTWEVRDSLGFPVTLTKKVTVRFSILGGPGGGEYLLPNSVDSDAKGRVSTRVNSGTTAGVVQVYATTRGDTVQSGPTKITITTGLPDQAHFSMTATKVNLPGGTGLPNGDNQKTSFAILAGDRFGNPAQAGTAIYFTTTGGVVQPTATTGSSGSATSELSTGNPRPAGGIATVTARTIGDSGAVVTASLPIVFSGATRILAPSSTFTIPDSGFNEILYEVQDQNGNPLSGGTTIKASVTGPGAGGLELLKDADVTIPDTRDTNKTNFVVRIEKNARGGANGGFDLKLEVNSPNNATGRVEFILVPGFTQKTGTGQGGGGGGGGGPLNNPTADKMEFVGSSRQSIIVNDGANQDKSKTTLTFLVKDSVGNPLINPVDPSLSKKYVTFAVFPSDGITGGEALTITGDSTNEFAQVSTTLLAGTKSGIFRVVATTIQSGKPPITAEGEIIIKAGPPDAVHFGIGAANYNFPGLQILSDAVRDNIIVAIGDKFGNPVEAGTRVYFNTSHGFVTAESATDANGFLRVDLLAALPKPVPPNSIASLGGDGFGVVRARTFADAGVELKDSVVLLWSGKPIINVTVNPGTFAVANGGSAGPWSFTVFDYLGHPMSAGTSIQVAAGDAQVGGNANTSLPDATVGGSGITNFTFTLIDSNPTDVDPPKPAVLTITVNHPVYGSFSTVVTTGTVD